MPDEPEGDDLVAVIQKNTTEEIRLTLGEFNGYRLFNMRTFFEAKDGSMRPGKSGLAFRVERLPEFAEAVTEALRRARERGLC